MIFTVTSDFLLTLFATGFISGTLAGMLLIYKFKR